MYVTYHEGVILSHIIHTKIHIASLNCINWSLTQIQEILKILDTANHIIYILMLQRKVMHKRKDGNTFKIFVLKNTRQHCVHNLEFHVKWNLVGNNASSEQAGWKPI